MKANVNGQGTAEIAIIEALFLSELLLKKAEKGIATCKEDGCMLLYGVIRDCGYKLRRTVNQEQFGP